MPFQEIVGHAPVVGSLRRALAQGRLAHAYLFWGEPGIGKRFTAVHLAMAVNCPHGTDDGCGTCPSCGKVRRGSHPDVRVLEPDEKDTIKVEAVREACEFLSLRPMEGRRKVVILDGAECMTASASNALLKTLEEPPGESLLILVASQQNALLPTVVSRCQGMRFAPMPSGALAQWLQRTRGLSPEDAALLAERAEGRVGAALGLRVEEVRREQAAFQETLRTAIQGNLGDLFRTAEALAKQGDPETFLEWYARWARGLMLRKAGAAAAGQHAFPAPGEENLTVREGLAFLDAWRDTHSALARNANPRLALETLLLRTRHAVQAADPEAVPFPRKENPCLPA